MSNKLQGLCGHGRNTPALLAGELNGGSMKKTFVSFVCAFGMLLLSFSSVLADVSSHESAEDLMFINLQPVMTATLTKIDASKIPASITVITKEDIALTPARNIEDLIDVYVPGAFTMNHHEDPHFAMR